MLARSLAASLALAMILGAGPARADEPDTPRSPQGQPPEPKPRPAPEPATSATSSLKAEPKGPRIERATFGGGCFWSFEATFERVPGVVAVTSGFAGGSTPNPTYAAVCTGETGHAEVIRVEYDANVVSYEALLHLFWHAHDPTQYNAQGDDVGTQYRSIILYADEAQRKAALKSFKDEQAIRRGHRARLTTQIVPLAAFFPAEPYHQDYFANHPDNEYSTYYILPKLAKLRRAKLIR